jgi:ketosteroid isomerase-like protein
MSNSDLIRKYFSAYENKDRKAVESLLTEDFVFTSPYDYRIYRETYFQRCWPYTEGSPTYGIEKLFEKGNEAFILCDCTTKNGGTSLTRSSSPSKEARKRNRGLLWFYPKGTSVNNDYRNLW